MARADPKAEMKAERPPPRPALGLAAGIAAGLVASATMVALQKRAARLRREAGATVSVPEPDAVGSFTHYLVGGMLGGVYGVLAEYRHDAPAGFGTALGLATAALGDQFRVHAAKAKPGAEQAHAVAPAPNYNKAMYLMYGITLDGLRALMARRGRG